MGTNDSDRIYQRLRAFSRVSRGSSPPRLSAALASIAPTFGPVLGGWITDTWSWHWLFYINVVPGVVVGVLVPLLVKIDRPNLALLKDADYIGIALMALFLGCLEYVLEEGPRWFGSVTRRSG